jgi:hypothetical protein
MLEKHERMPVHPSPCSMACPLVGTVHLHTDGPGMLSIYGPDLPLKGEVHEGYPDEVPSCWVGVGDG